MCIPKGLGTTYLRKPNPNLSCATETAAERKNKQVTKCRYITHMNQNNTNRSGLQNTKTTLKEHGKEQQKKHNNEAPEIHNLPGK